MCLIALYSPMTKLIEAKIDVNFDHLKNAWYWNEDGAGFSYVDYGLDHKPTLVIQKNYEKFEVFREALEIAMLNNPDSKFMVHLRNASRGKVESQNCHPFKVSDDVVMCHNGTFTSLGDKDKGPSDSKIFANMLSKLPINFLSNKGYTELIKSYVGYSNRLAFLSINNEIITFGNGWIKHKEGFIQYSNDYYERIIPTKTENVLPFKSKDEQDKVQKCKCCGIELNGTWEIKNGVCFSCKTYFSKNANYNVYDESQLDC